MNPLLGRATGMLRMRAAGGAGNTGTVRIGGPGKGGSGGSAPAGGGLMALRSRIRRPASGGPMTMKRPPMEPDGDEMA